MKLTHRRVCSIVVLFCVFLAFGNIIWALQRLKHSSDTGGENFLGDLTGIKHRADTLRLNLNGAPEEEKALKEPPSVVYKDGDHDFVVSENTSDKNISSSESGNTGVRVEIPERHGVTEDRQIVQGEKQPSHGGELPDQSNKIPVRHDQPAKPSPRKVLDEKIEEMKDNVMTAQAYLYFAQAKGNSRLVKELKTRIKEMERSISEAIKDSRITKSIQRRITAMDGSLLKASHLYSDCSAMSNKLRAMAYNAEEQVRAASNQVTYLVDLTARTTPKGLHCLSMRLTADYFALQPEERELPNQHILDSHDLYHHAIFSDNVLASAVVVNSLVSSATRPEKIVIHVLTDNLNLPSIKMWFLSNPSGKATIEVRSVDDIELLVLKSDSTTENQNSINSRYTSPLNHLRFYLPEIFPRLNKIVLLDHDVVVQRDLTNLWSIDMKGKVNGAVMTCERNGLSYRRMDMLVNFSDPMVAKMFDGKRCTWAFGMNLFDLGKWRDKKLTNLYKLYSVLAHDRPILKSGNLPIGWLTFYNYTVAVNSRWHVLGLGYESGVGRSDIERAAVIHYDGVRKPWLDIAIEKYKDYWTKYINYDHPYFQQCNLHP